MASNESFKQAIKAYLDKRAEEDSLFAPKYANEKKSIDEDRKSTRLNSSHMPKSRMPSSA